MHKKDSLDFPELPLSNFLVTNILTVIMRGYLPSTGRGDASIDEDQSLPVPLVKT